MSQTDETFSTGRIDLFTEHVGAYSRAVQDMLNWFVWQDTLTAQPTDNSHPSVVYVTLK